MLIHDPSNEILPSSNYLIDPKATQNSSPIPRLFGNSGVLQPFPNTGAQGSKTLDDDEGGVGVTSSCSFLEAVLSEEGVFLLDKEEEV